MIPNILKNPSNFIMSYPMAVEFTDKQLSVFWTHTEIKVEKDIQDLLVKMTPEEKHGVITTLKLFTLYEVKAGSEYWSGWFMKKFKRPEFQRMAVTFAMIELSVHKPFYSKINELLFLDNDVFYNSYVEDPTLKARMEFIDEIISSKGSIKDDLVSLAGFSMVEGAILYSSLAFLKHFQSQGKNTLLNVVRGINFSVRDENIHCLAGAYVFKTLLNESELSEDELLELKSKVVSTAEKLYQHECRIVDMIFEKGPIDGITSKQMKHFVESRINECLLNLGYEKLFEVDYNPISGWFYKSINSFTYNDFFIGISNSYHRLWGDSDFVWELSKGVEIK